MDLTCESSLAVERQIAFDIHSLAGFPFLLNGHVIAGGGVGDSEWRPSRLNATI